MLIARSFPADLKAAGAEGSAGRQADSSSLEGRDSTREVVRVARVDLRAEDLVEDRMVDLEGRVDRADRDGSEKRTLILPQLRHRETQRLSCVYTKRTPQGRAPRLGKGRRG